MDNIPTRDLLGQFFLLGKSERRPVGLAIAYAFMLLSSYTLLKPLRDEIGSAHFEHLSSLWTGTFFAMLVAVPVYSWVASKARRSFLISIVYRFFLLNLAVFFFFLRSGNDPEQQSNVWVEYLFYIWTSVFNLFVVSMFWSLMSDLFKSEQGRRLFGLVMLGSSLGAIVGPLLATALVTRVPSEYLILIAMALLEVATRIAKKLNKLRLSLGTDSPRPIGGNIWSGFSAIFSSPYLLLLAAYLLLYLVAPGFIYFMKAELSREAFVDRSHRVAFFAQVELAANSLTLLLQVLVTGRVLKNLGVTAGLLILPLLTLILFAGLGMWTVLPIVVACDIARRVGNFAFAKPAREILYTVVSPEERYKSKTILDTVVYRGGDVAVGWFYSMLSGIGFAMSQIVWVVVPIAGLWATVGVILGRAHRRRAE